MLRQSPDLDPIAEHADRVGDKDVSPEALDARLAQIEAQVEFLIEERGLENAFRTEVTNYVKDLRDDAKFVKTARKIFGAIGVLAALGLLIAPAWLVYSEVGVFTTLPDYPKAAVLIGMLAGGVLLIQALVKSVYRSGHERHGDEFIPPQVKAIHELTRTDKP